MYQTTIITIFFFAIIAPTGKKYQCRLKCSSVIDTVHMKPAQAIHCNIFTAYFLIVASLPCSCSYSLINHPG